MLDGKVMAGVLTYSADNILSIMPDLEVGQKFLSLASAKQATHECIVNLG